ncbi:ABC-type transport auxiliary lipoprotein family protein [Brevundimonas sp.]|uniref:ABC-type transport auxiliary lipoprotein family protein n=1 Tax=Brevundimonas sp. TaxID=1871086 RepID=UPI0024892FF4|nr:ABC-type transport auxiliary lipoprotein family protein [Brevundimonas sp.]MDI1279789.1 ABC-type transport auxiliary lipoprotein family protein [Brevundimonas sp.]
MFVRLSAVTAAVAVLGGCSLLATPDPVQLYRFGAGAEVGNGPVLAEPIQVALRRIEFPDASKGDRMLGITGTEAAYIAGARWVSPAEDLYAQSLQESFLSQASRVRLIGRRELTPTTRTLDIDVRTFEARYEQAGTVPLIVISATARMLRLPERTVVSERTFTVSQPASENRVSSIVAAFDIASRDLNTLIVDWTEVTAAR